MESIALLIAARLHGFRRTQREVTRVVRICDETLRQRISESGVSAAAAVTPDEFNELAAKTNDFAVGKDAADDERVATASAGPPVTWYPEHRESSADSMVVGRRRSGYRRVGELWTSSYLQVRTRIELVRITCGG